MTGPFGEDELFEDEWVEISDVEGRKAAMRHLATIRIGEKTYMILGTGDGPDFDEDALMLVREDRTVDGELEYVVSSDEQEIERIVGQFAMHVFAGEMPEAFEGLPTDFSEGCGCEHRAGEFCYCDDPAYLQ